MKIGQLETLPPNARKIIEDLMQLIPSWKYVDLTKNGYNQQYTQTLIDVAIYVIEREKDALKNMVES